MSAEITASDYERPYHFAELNREEVIIIGFKKQEGTVLVAVPAAMPVEDANMLKRIALSEGMQKEDVLAVPLTGVQHTSGVNWFEWLLRSTNSTRGGGFLRHVTLKDLSKFNPDQKAFFKGYGKKRSDLKDQSNPPPMTDEPVSAQTFEITEDEAAEVFGKPLVRIEEEQDSVIKSSTINALTLELTRLNNLLTTMIASKNNQAPAKAAKKRGRPKKAVVPQTAE